MSTTYSLPKGALSTTGAGPEMSQSDVDYKTEIDRLEASLKERKGLDPTMLALAQGFFAPTKTGGFGESISNAVANYAPAQQAEEKAIQERAGLRLQLLTAKKNDDNRRAAQQAFQQVTGGATAPVGGQAVNGQGGAQVESGGQAPAPAEMRNVTIQDALKFAGAFPDQKDLAARMMEAAKAGLDRYGMSMNGIVFDKQAGKYLNVDIPGQTQSAYSTPYGTFQMLPNEYSRFTMAQKAGMGKEWMNAFKQGAHFDVDKLVAQKIDGGPAKAATPQVTEGGRKTVSEQEADSAAAKTRAEAMAKAAAERTNLVMDSAKAARGATAGYTRANEILADTGVQKHLGVLNRGDVTSAIGNMVNEAFRVGNYSVGVPAIKDILQKSGAPQEVIDKLLELSQIEAMWQMESRKGLGSGTSVSNMEQMMANRVTPNQDDPIGAYRQKLKFLQEKSKFDIELSKALKRTKMDYDQFEDTPEFDRMFNGYQSRLMSVVNPGSKKAPATANTQSGTGTSAAGAQLRNELGIK